MKNVDIKQEKGKLTISIDLTKNFGSSRSGKSTVIASTEGNEPLDEEGVFLGLNVYKK